MRKNISKRTRTFLVSFDATCSSSMTTHPKATASHKTVFQALNIYSCKKYATKKYVIFVELQTPIILTWIIRFLFEIYLHLITIRQQIVRSSHVYFPYM